MADLPSNKKIKQFYDYLIEIYIRGIFPSTLCALSSEIITNNVCESFHSKFNAYFYHPSMYKFIDVLRDVQDDTYIKIRSAKPGLIQ